MIFHRKKSSIDRRLEKLHQELLRVNRNIKTVSRSSSAMPAGKLSAPLNKQRAPRPVSDPNPADGIADATGIEPADDLLTRAANGGPVKPADLFPGLSAKTVEQSRAVASTEHHGSRSRREKFANYFMAGHFHNLLPSRQESRVLRNKAILMMIAVVALLAWLLYFWRSH